MTSWRDPLAEDEDPDAYYASLMSGDEELAAHLEALLARPAWWALAACRGLGTDAFFVERGTSTEPAKAMCSTCPVLDRCAEAGRQESHGIWAGMTTKKLRKARQDAA